MRVWQSERHTATDADASTQEFAPKEEEKKEEKKNYLDR